MIDRAWAEEFARDWIESWNAHDLERIMAHYSDDFETTSPLIAQRLGLPDGTLRGKKAVRKYFGNGLATTPHLHFKLLDVAVGVRSVAIIYESATLERVVIELIEIDD